MIEQSIRDELIEIRILLELMLQTMESLRQAMTVTETEHLRVAVR